MMKIAENLKPGCIFCLTNRKYYDTEECVSEEIFFKSLSDAVSTLELNLEEVEGCEVRAMNNSSEFTLNDVEKCFEEYGSFNVTLSYEKDENQFFSCVQPSKEMYIISKMVTPLVGVRI